MALCPVGWVECRGIEWNGSLDVSQQGKDLFRAWVVGVAVESVCVCVCVCASLMCVCVVCGACVRVCVCVCVHH